MGNSIHNKVAKICYEYGVSEEEKVNLRQEFKECLLLEPNRIDELPGSVGLFVDHLRRRNNAWYSIPYYGQTFLHISCIGGDTDLVKWLLELGANPNIYCYSKIDMELTALLAVCYYGHLDLIVLLTKHPRVDLSLTAPTGKKAIEILAELHPQYVSAFVRAEKERSESL